MSLVTTHGRLLAKSSAVSLCMSVKMRDAVYEKSHTLWHYATSIEIEASPSLVRCIQTDRYETELHTSKTNGAQTLADRPDRCVSGSSSEIGARKGRGPHKRERRMPTAPPSVSPSPLSLSLSLSLLIPYMDRCDQLPTLFNKHCSLPPTPHVLRPAPLWSIPH